MNLQQFPVNPTDPALADTQGNILKGHGRDFTFNLFLSFVPSKQAAVSQWIASFSSSFVTSTQKQLAETALFHAHHVPGGIFTAFFLSAVGYTYLGVPAAKVPTNPAFKQGMQAAGPALHDPAPATWTPGLNGSNGALHALLLIADDDLHLARAMVKAVTQSLAGLATVAATERGVVLRNALGDGIEHNGYVDGISQPVYFQNEQTFEPSAPPFDWDPAAAPGLALVVDPGGTLGPNSLGSYFVFRKLEQNVRGFKDNEKAVADAVLVHNADPNLAADPELAGAMIVGRFEGGTPVLLSRHDTNPGPGHQENNFNYAQADSASKCPFQAHIRKTGPRTDGAGAAFNKTKRLTRRGIPFEDKARIRDANGNLSPLPADLPTGGVGLLFMCYVADIGGQFEFVQEQWVDSASFARAGTGIDPVIGQPHLVPPPTYQWPTFWGSTQTKPAPFGSFVTMRGGEYFFAPSLSMLKSLSAPAALNPVLLPFVPDLVDALIPPAG